MFAPKPSAVWHVSAVRTVHAQGPLRVLAIAVVPMSAAPTLDMQTLDMQIIGVSGVTLAAT
jgi:hypothetical protein